VDSQKNSWQRGSGKIGSSGSVRKGGADSLKRISIGDGYNPIEVAPGKRVSQGHTGTTNTKMKRVGAPLRDLKGEYFGVKGTESL